MIVTHDSAYDSIFVVKKLDDPGSIKVSLVYAIIQDLAKRLDIVLVDDPNKLTAKGLIIAVGGDGTMIAAMKIAHTINALVIGINLGKVGFLTDIPVFNDQPDDLVAFRRKLFDFLTLQYNTSIQNRRILEYSSPNGITGTAINEIVISQSTYETVIKYRLTVDGMNAGIHRANSVMVSTPTGSTAYSLSAGGALIFPTMGVLQIVPVAPITLSSRPIIVSMKSEIELEVWGGLISVKEDGQSVYSSDELCTESNPAKFLITGSSVGIDTVSFPNWNFFTNLSEKLHWINQ